MYVEYCGNPLFVGRETSAKQTTSTTTTTTTTRAEVCTTHDTNYDHWDRLHRVRTASRQRRWTSRKRLKSKWNWMANTTHETEETMMYEATNSRYTNTFTFTHNHMPTLPVGSTLWIPVPGHPHHAPSEPISCFWTCFFNRFLSSGDIWNHILGQWNVVVTHNLLHNHKFTMPERM